MKYFTKELWKRINSDNVLVCNNAMKEWEERTNEYVCAFNLIKEKFPRTFLKVYDQNEGFHDFELKSITFQAKRKKHNCELHLTRHNDHAILFLSDLSVFSVDFPALSLENCVGGKITWGYAELDYSSDHMFCISILFDYENEMMLRAKKMKIKFKRQGLSCKHRLTIKSQ